MSHTAIEAAQQLHEIGQLLRKESFPANYMRSDMQKENIDREITRAVDQLEKEMQQSLPAFRAGAEAMARAVQQLNRALQRMPPICLGDFFPSAYMSRADQVLPQNKQRKPLSTGITWALHQGPTKAEIDAAMQARTRDLFAGSVSGTFQAPSQSTQHPLDKDYPNLQALILAAGYTEDQAAEAFVKGDKKILFTELAKHSRSSMAARLKREAQEE